MNITKIGMKETSKAALKDMLRSKDWYEYNPRIGGNLCCVFKSKKSNSKITFYRNSNINVHFSGAIKTKIEIMLTELLMQEG